MNYYRRNTKRKTNVILNEISEATHDMGEAAGQVIMGGVLVTVGTIIFVAIVKVIQFVWDTVRSVFGM